VQPQCFAVRARDDVMMLWADNPTDKHDWILALRTVRVSPLSFEVAADPVQARIIKCGTLHKHSVAKGSVIFFPIHRANRSLVCSGERPKAERWHRRWFVLQRRSLGLYRREAVCALVSLILLSVLLSRDLGCRRRSGWACWICAGPV
jgi:hypothetical protein